MIILGVVLAVLIVLGIYIYRKKFINQVYESAEGRFTIKGKKNRFKICKDENIEFLVENGQIVACKDKRINDEFKFYGGDNNGVSY